MGNSISSQKQLKIELYQKILKFLEKEMERIEKEIDQPGNSIIKKRKRDDKPRTKIVRL